MGVRRDLDDRVAVEVAKPKRLGPKRAGLIPVIDRRLQTWGEWRLANDGQWSTEAAGSSMLGKLIDGGGELSRTTNPSAGSMPDDVFDTCRAVSKLPDKLQMAVEVQYMCLDLTHDEKAKKCGCVSKTLYNRLESAHQKILMTLKAPRGGAKGGF